MRGVYDVCKWCWMIVGCGCRIGMRCAVCCLVRVMWLMHVCCVCGVVCVVCCVCCACMVYVALCDGCI